jgi:hypothetical protein
VKQEKGKTEKEALKLLAETITLSAFFQFMRSRIETWHNVAGAIAYGGKAQLDAERKARIAAKIDSELTFLAGFKADTAQAIAAARDAGIDVEEALGFVPNRAGMYADAAYSTFANNEMAREFDNGVTMGRRICPDDEASCSECPDAATEEFIPLDDIPEIGSLQCLNNCRCSLEFSTVEVPFVGNANVQDAGGSEAVQ